MPMQPVNKQSTSPTQQILPGGCYDTRPQPKCKPSFGDMCREMFTRKPAQCPQDCADLLKGFMSVIKDLIDLLKDCGKSVCEKKCKPKEEKPKECKKCEEPDDSIPNPPKGLESQTAKIEKDDITEADGGKFVSGAEHNKVYNLLSDGDVQVNARTISDRLNEVGLRFGDNQIHMSELAYFTPTAGPTLNGTRLEDGKPQKISMTSAVTGKPVEAEVVWDEKSHTLTMTTPEYKVAVNAALNPAVPIPPGGPQPEAFLLNVQVSTNKDGVWTDWVDPEGILGNTFDPDSNQLSAIRGNYSEYEVNDGLFGAGYQRNRFNKAPKEFAKDASGNVTEVKAADGTVLWEKE